MWYSKTGGRGRIRTSVARKERQIYSLLVLATHPPVPQNHLGRRLRRPVNPSGHSFIVPRYQLELYRTAVRGTPQCRKGSCPKTPTLALLSRGILSATLQKFCRAFKVSWRRELNPRPSDYKSDALPTELRQHWQTEQMYHSGIQIASNFLPPAKPLPDRHFPRHSQYHQCSIIQLIPFFVESSFLTLAASLPAAQVHRQEVPRQASQTARQPAGRLAAH